MASTFLNLSTDTTLGGNSPSDTTAVSQKAIKSYVSGNYVTTSTDQDISGTKTFIGEKRIKFKQSASGNKLGFTLYDNDSKEAAAFEYRPNTISGYPLMYLGQYIGSGGVSYVSTPIYVGFRCYDNAYNASYNLVAPLAKDAKSSFSLDRNYKTFYLPFGVTDGNTTVTTGSDGVLDVSSLLPTVNNATLTITQGGTTKGTFTANASSDVTIDLDAGGGGGGTPSNMVTTDTAQTITGTKTFVGEKKIKFKQSASGNKLGFTLYDNDSKEAAAFEYRPNTINSYPLMYLGQYKGSGTSYISTPIYVGFRCFDNAYNASYNLVAPLAKDAKSSFSLNTSYKTFYLPLGLTDGNTTVTTGSDGVLDVSSLLPTVNNATLTITQGGTTKGTFTANASSDVTIDLDAGGGGGGTPSNMVTTDTAQTITGTKTFVGDSWITKIKNNTVTYNYAPASDVWTSIAFMDANDMQMGTVDCWRKPDNSTVMQLNVFGHSGYWGSNLGQSLQFGVDSNNKAFALAPNPRANPNTNEIATVSWVDGTSNDVLHKSRPETITGTKTFEGNQWVTKFKNTTVAYNVAPVSGDVSTSIAFVDNNDNAMGTVDCWRYRDNSTEIALGIHTANGAWITNTLRIKADSNGNSYAYAPTPAASSNSDEIATTAWVNTAISGKQDVSNLVTSVSSSSTDSQYPSAKLFYDTVGDIETALHAINSGGG